MASPPAAPYARPLVAVDCSDTSQHAVELAWRLANPGLQALDVVHAYEPIRESTGRHFDLFGAPARQFNFEAKLQAQAAVETFLAASDAAGPANIMLREETRGR